jgi:TctA family transporter
MLEENFRRALLLSRGSFTTFVKRPISGTLLGLIGIFVIWQVAAFLLEARRSRERHAKSEMSLSEGLAGGFSGSEELPEQLRPGGE